MLKVYATPLALAVAGLALFVLARPELAVLEIGWRQVGLGLMGLGVTLALFLLLFGVRRAGDLAGLKTPRSAVTFYSAAAITWLSFVPAEWVNLKYAHPPHLPSEPSQAVMASVMSFALAGLPFVLLGVYLCIRTTSLPVQLWTGPFFSSFVGVAVLLALVGSVGVFVEGVCVNVFLLPSSVATVYLLLCGRAAAARAA